MIPMNEMPDHSRVWIYQSDRAFSNEEVAKIEKLLTEFINNWSTHGTSLKASGAVLYNRFVIIMAYEATVKASGCSIDKSVAFIKQLEKEFNCDFFNRLKIAYKEGNEVKTFHFNEKEELISKGVISSDTIIFNNLVQTKSELFTNWQVKIKDSWLNMLN
jgi:hypothetical protein